MIRTIVIAGLVASGLAGAVAPAMAATAIADHPIQCDSSMNIDEHSDQLVQQLRERGVNATDVESWNGCIRAYVTQPGGGQAMQFYDPDTLQLIGTDNPRG